MDVIETFTGKTVGELSAMPRPAEARYREYDAASNAIYRGAKAPVWKLKASKELQEDVLGRVMPWAEQPTWTTRAASHEALLKRVQASMEPPVPARETLVDRRRRTEPAPVPQMARRNRQSKRSCYYRTYDSDVRRRAIADGKAAGNNSYMTFLGFRSAHHCRCRIARTWERRIQGGSSTSA